MIDAKKVDCVRHGKIYPQQPNTPTRSLVRLVGLVGLVGQGHHGRRWSQGDPTACDFCAHLVVRAI